jgi:hypothetical protein
MLATELNRIMKAYSRLRAVVPLGRIRADDPLTLIIAMTSAQGDRAFTIDQFSQIGRIYWGQQVDYPVGHGATPEMGLGEMVKKKPPACDRGLSANLVEAAGQLFHPFGMGWTIPSSRLPGMRGVLSDVPDPSARPPAWPVGESMSL